MLPTQQCIDRLANQIERAYFLRPFVCWNAYASREVWAAAAHRLWQVHADDPDMPLDAALFVASQRLSSASRNPWSQLTEPESGRRYRAQVKRIVRLLRVELNREVRLAEKWIAKGLEIESVLLTDHPRLSSLGRYITAHRSSRPDLAAQLVTAALDQHRSCSLYRAASESLIPTHLYPDHDRQPSHAADAPTRQLPHHDLVAASYQVVGNQPDPLQN